MINSLVDNHKDEYILKNEKIDVLVLNYNDYETTLNLVNSILNYEIIDRIVVVDNKSTDNSLDILKTIASNKIIVLESEKNGGYGYGNNVGIKYLLKNGNNRLVLLCNPDIVIDAAAINELNSFMCKNEEYIIAAPYMLNSNKIKTHNTAFKISSSFAYIMSNLVFLNKIFRFCEYKKISENDDYFLDVDAVSGSLFIFDKYKMENIKMFDENIFLFCEERVIGLKAKDNNYKIALLPKINFVHNHSVSIKKSIKSYTKINKILKKSKTYVLREYYKIGTIKMIIFKVTYFINYIENIIINFFKKR